MTLTLSPLEATIDQMAVRYARRMKRPAEFVYLGNNEVRRLGIILSARHNRDVSIHEMKLCGLTVLTVNVEHHMRVA